MKYASASDSLRPGQLDRLVAKIKDRGMEADEFCRECGQGALYGYRTICVTCCSDQGPDWESFKGDGYKTDIQVCRKCGERRTI